MAILKIAKMGDPVLRTRAQEVVDPTTPQIHALIRDMTETLADAGGAGLAAPQVHVALRIVIFHQPPEDGAEDGPGEAEGQEGSGDGGGDGEESEEQRDPLTILVNPVIEPLGDDMVAGWEACLSVPGMQGIVPRFTSIRYSGLGADGQTIECEARGFHARVVQHECDHLDGILYPQRMTDLRLLGFTDEWERHPLHFAPEDEEEGEAADEARGNEGGGAAGA